MAVKISIRELATPIGTLMISASERGVTGIEFDKGDIRRTREAMRRRLVRRFGPEVELTGEAAPLNRVSAWLTSYFDNPVAAGPYGWALDPGGSEFQRAVWLQLTKIPVGEVRTYGEVAKAIGNPGAVRAVGGACGANPVCVVVPCHRVVASGGPGGFGGGLELKRRMLAREGFTLS